MMGNPVGKPKKTLSDLDAGWYNKVLEEMSEGASLDEIKTMLRISNDLHTRWMKEELEYSETIKEGLSLSKSWWQKQGRVNLENKQFSATLWYMNMKNRFGWRDNVDHTTQGKALPTPIYGGQSVQGHDSDQEDISA